LNRIILSFQREKRKPGFKPVPREILVYVKEAIKIHGTTCTVCGFNFERKYGKFGEGYIEIHHLKPHASIRGERAVDPKSDLVPLCSNCHRMIHKPDPMLTIEELKKAIHD
jgi:5-methylcytosine-specific restriction protein A